MQPGLNKGSNLQSPSEDDQRYLRLYGRLPERGRLLGQHFKERTYFDSGDLALSTADRVTDNGAIQTGTAHPMRDSISRPYAPVPNTSNVNEDANRDFIGKKSPSPEMIGSPLHHKVDDSGNKV